MPRRGRRDVDDLLQRALACGATVEAAARQAGVSPATVYRRKTEPAFQQKIQQMRADMMQRTTGMLLASGGEAARALLSQVQQETTPPPTRRAAARDIIELGNKMWESTELEQRIAALEEMARDNAEDSRRGR
jgi:hypothetical protein